MTIILINTTNDLFNHRNTNNNYIFIILLFFSRFLFFFIYHKEYTKLILYKKQKPIMLVLLKYIHIYLHINIYIHIIYIFYIHGKCINFYLTNHKCKRIMCKFYIIFSIFLLNTHIVVINQKCLTKKLINYNEYSKKKGKNKDKKIYRIPPIAKQCRLS